MSTTPKVWPGEYRFCPRCTTELERRHAKGKERNTCPNCGFIHFRNPGVGAAVVVFDDDDRLLLVQRAQGMTKEGLWCIPCGYVDYGEDVRDGAARELLEETGLVADVGEPVFVASNFHDPAKLTVGIWFAGTVTGGALEAGDDASDAGFFALDALPPLAFDTDQALVQKLRAERTG